MKKIFGIGVVLFALLMVCFVQAGHANTALVDQDVGYMLTISDQNTVTVPTIQNPVIAGEAFYLIDRGVSVPYRGLMISENVCNYNQIESIQLYLQLCLNNGDESILGLRSVSWANSLYNSKPADIGTCKHLNYQRGVNTRLTDFKLTSKT